MQSRDFAFWLNGFFELGGGTGGLSQEQVEMIKTHLALVFEHDASIKQNVGSHQVPHPFGSQPGYRFPNEGVTRVIC